MLTVHETPLFQTLWPRYWSQEDRAEFAAWISLNPQAGDVIPQSAGVRKVRWKRPGSGKSGGVRVICFTRLSHGELILMLMYTKSEYDTVAAQTLKELKHAIEKALK
jgi:RelE toxin of RelE / RelB toxin-antitoxin system